MTDLRQILDQRDVERLIELLALDPGQARTSMGPWPDHPLGTTPLSYVAMLRYDTIEHIWREVSGTGPMARALLAAGAPVDGHPGARETPLMTAASYGDAEVAQVLIEAGADLEATAAAEAGGVPGGTALLHAAVFGMTDVLNLLVTAGARIPDLVLAAAAGELSGWSVVGADPQARLLALIMAAQHERLNVIDELIVAGTPVDAVDPVWGRQALRVAAGEGRPAGVRALLAHGADPTLRDRDGRTALDHCRSEMATHPGNVGHEQVAVILGALDAPGRSTPPRQRDPD